MVNLAAPRAPHSYPPQPVFNWPQFQILVWLSKQFKVHRYWVVRMCQILTNHSTVRFSTCSLFNDWRTALSYYISWQRKHGTEQAYKREQTHKTQQTFWGDSNELLSHPAQCWLWQYTSRTGHLYCLSMYEQSSLWDLYRWVCGGVFGTYQLKGSLLYMP